ncbi:MULTISPECIES: hypothetical protein [unclassified Streptomyces]|uniref:hypothetical protein n=1 Tax=unclassified Streptomyces TaxID=2593676 RepID=UPI0009A0A8F1|nr:MULTISPECIES: hypothetical protein [unclassified Streptomyces]
MGWTHDHVDAAHDRRSASAAPTPERSGPQEAVSDGHLGIPRILRRRARWVSARLRHHPRG